MKLFSSKKKIAIIGTMLTTMLAGTIAYAATPIKQDAYYDTFKLVVNGTEQFISDTALKPFIANSRVYVPIATLQNLGIANVQWTPAASGQAASLAVSPKGGTAGGDSPRDPPRVSAPRTLRRFRHSANRGAWRCRKRVPHCCARSSGPAAAAGTARRNGACATGHDGPACASRTW